ncbi:hypothetical protein A6F55_23735 [Prescottella equi]|uniref:hypothetical protein n=1 Tax=Rhodococcus hoagii TaxID=43767 RepID=UPI000A109751|nr:hypothetical protein [Prescottella equi]ORJ92580.1 hypothetical protein A6F55_23735 [Prescottella equi]
MTTPATPEKYITAANVAALLGETLEEAELTRIEQLIVFAAPKLRSLVPRLDQRVASGKLDVDQVRGTLASAVAQAYESLRIGLMTKSEQFPELSTTYRVGPDLIWFSKNEINSLLPGADGTGSAFSIRIGGAR